ncbi:MAG: hypothetical protein RBR09_02965 [Desulfobulbaceae bacterium]|jgi:hypothetical protein|nr:hypothetical protein [Desulfobulbaceae bacterium]MDY0350192.1 hypothetical protein [Desulfobulbaceae bacterium]
MVCKEGEGCPVRNRSAGKCWEKGVEAGGHPWAAGICRECIVYLLRNKRELFSEEELRALAERRVSCSCFLLRS